MWDINDSSSPCSNATEFSFLIDQMRHKSYSKYAAREKNLPNPGFSCSSSLIRFHLLCFLFNFFALCQSRIWKITCATHANFDGHIIYSVCTKQSNNCSHSPHWQYVIQNLEQEQKLIMINQTKMQKWWMRRNFTPQYTLIYAQKT